jgi:hypothetical protein
MARLHARGRQHQLGYEPITMARCLLTLRCFSNVLAGGVSTVKYMGVPTGDRLSLIATPQRNPTLLATVTSTNPLQHPLYHIERADCATIPSQTAPDIYQHFGIPEYNLSKRIETLDAINDSKTIKSVLCGAATSDPAIACHCLYVLSFLHIIVSTCT